MSEMRALVHIAVPTHDLELAEGAADLLVVTHGSPIRLATLRLEGRGFADFHHLNIGNPHRVASIQRPGFRAVSLGGCFIAFALNHLKLTTLSATLYKLLRW